MFIGHQLVFGQNDQNPIKKFVSLNKSHEFQSRKHYIG